MWCMDTCRGALCPPSPATCLSPAVLLGADGEQHPCMRGLPLCSYSGGGMGGLYVSWWLKISIWKPTLQRFPLRPVTHTAVPGGSAHGASPRPE